MWNSLEANYRERLARLDERSRLQGSLDWLKTIPVKELIQRGKVHEQPDPLSLLEEVLRFFGVADVDAWKEGWETYIERRLRQRSAGTTSQPVRRQRPDPTRAGR